MASADLTAAGSAGELRDLYATMARIRAFEERVGKHFRDGDIHGFVHVSIGQEAVAAGACAALERNDIITTTHRGHGHCIAKGADPEQMYAELFGRTTGLCRGKGGSMHIADPALGILGANGIVGAGIPLAVGAGLAARVGADGRVALAFFGEGAVHCGAFHEAVTLAVAWSLPVLFLCENNGYAEFTPMSAHTVVSHVSVHGQPYGIASEIVDGNDTLAVLEAGRRAVARAREGAGPTIVECLTYRLRGHYVGDPEAYRKADEVAEWRDKDPIRRFGGQLIERRIVAQQDIAAMEAAARARVDEAVRFMTDSPWPAPTSVADFVYA
jgi:TPP-dependent pyruvate/acetoin dehydrogenase alpha subunit